MRAEIAALRADRHARYAANLAESSLSIHLGKRVLSQARALSWAPTGFSTTHAAAEPKPHQVPAEPRPRPAVLEARGNGPLGPHAARDPPAGRPAPEC
jgi:hypothetical protein